MKNIAIMAALLFCFLSASRKQQAPASIPREEVIESAATPAAVQAGSDAPTDASTTPANSATATSEEAALAVVSLPTEAGVTRRGTWDTSVAESTKESREIAVSDYTPTTQAASIQPAPAPPLAPATVQAAAQGHAYSGRYVLVNRPIYGGWRGRQFLGYRQVWVPAVTSYTTYGRYFGNCANGRCN